MKGAEGGGIDLVGGVSGAVVAAHAGTDPHCGETGTAVAAVV
jgi:hypothetical protein